jgi:DNA-binding GntR family transcriptional regulator
MTLAMKRNAGGGGAAANNVRSSCLTKGKRMAVINDNVATPGLSQGQNPGNGSLSGSLLKERAYSEIRARILSGESAPGTFLSERQMAAQFGMSKTPVRAALQRLEQEGFVTISPQQGIIVRDLSIREIADQYEIRLALECYVLRNVAGRLTPAQVDCLRANLEAQERICRAFDVDRGVVLDAEFHTLFCEFLGNQEILRVLGQLRAKMHRVIAQVFKINPTRMANSYEEHRGIADAVIQGDAAAAARRIEEHLEYGKLHLLSPRRP